MLSIVTFAGLCYGLNAWFSRSANVNYYMGRAERLHTFADTAQATLDRMLANNDVTWDPTNGDRIGLVLGNLKRTRSAKMLIIGGSQFLVVANYWDPGYEDQRADYILKRISLKPLEVYNLSMGGMSAAEKCKILPAACDLMNFDYIIVSIMPFECSWDGGMESRLNFKIETAHQESTKVWDHFLDPKAFNATVSARCEALLETCVPLLHRRRAILSWLSDKISGTPVVDEELTVGGNYWLKQSPGPMQFDYTKEEAMILRNALSVVDMMGEVAAHHPGHYAVMLSPIRQDSRRPAFIPTRIVTEFHDLVAARCTSKGLTFLDATTLLDQSDFCQTMAEIQYFKEINPIHFDSNGHRRLAEFIAAKFDLR